MAIKKFEIVETKPLNESQRTSDFFDEHYNKFRTKVEQPVQEDVSFQDAFTSGFGQMSIFAETYKIAQDVGARHAFRDISVSLDKKKFVQDMIKDGFPIDIATEIANESDTEYEAFQRSKRYLDTQEDFKNISENPLAGYLGSGLGLTTDIVFGTSVFEAANVGSKAFKLNTVNKALQTTRAGLAVGAAEGALFNAISNEANQTSGGYELSVVLGGALGAVANKLTSRVQYGDQIEAPSVQRATPSTKTDEDLRADVNNGATFDFVNDAEVRVKDYRDSINQTIDKSNEVILESRDNITKLNESLASFDESNDLTKGQKLNDFFEKFNKVKDDLYSSNFNPDDLEKIRKDMPELEDDINQLKIVRESQSKLSKFEEELDVLSGDLDKVKKSARSPKSDDNIERTAIGKLADDPDAPRTILFGREGEQVPFTQKELSDEETKILDTIRGKIDELNQEAAEQARLTKQRDDIVNQIETNAEQINKATKTIDEANSEMSVYQNKMDNDIVDMDDVKFDNIRNASNRRYNAVKDIKDDTTESAQVIANNAMGNPIELTKAMHMAHKAGDTELYNRLSKTPIQDPITGEIKELSKLKKHELDEFGRYVSKSYNAGHIDTFLHAAGDVLRNSDVNTVRIFGQDFLGTRGNLDKDAVNPITASEHKDTFFNAERNRFYKTMQDGYEDYLKEVHNKNTGVLDKTFAQFRDNYDDYKRLVGDHQLIVQNNPEKAAEMPLSVQRTSEALSKQFGKAKERIRLNGWDEGDDIYRTTNDDPVSFMSRVLDKDKVQDIPKIFGMKGMKQFYTAMEGALISANPKWALVDAIKRNPEKAEELQALLDSLGDTINHADTTRILRALGDSSRQTSVIAKTMVNNAIRRSQLPTDAVSSHMAISVDKVLDDVLENKKLLEDLTESERKLMNDVITTHLSRKGINEKKPDQFFSRLKLDPSYTVKATQLDGREVDVSYLSMLSNDIDTVGHNQFMHLSNSFGLAKAGMKNNQDFLDRVNEARVAVGERISNRRDKKRELDTIEATRKYFMGEKHFDDSSALNKGSQVIKKINALKLGRLFMNILPEFANIKRVTGADTLSFPIMKSILSTYTKALRGAKSDSDLFKSLDAMGTISTASLSRVISNVESGILDTTTGAGKFNSSWGIDTRSMSSRAFDKVDNYADMINALMLQTYRPFERQQRLNVAAAAVQGIFNTLNKGGFESMSKSQKTRALDFGIDEEFFSNLQKSVDAGHFKVNSRGVIEDIDVDRMMRETPDFYDVYTATLNKEVSSNILQDTFEKSPVFTNGQLFSLFGQFRSFQILSLNHVMRYDMTRLDAAAGATLVYGSMLGGINYAMNEIASGRGEDIDIESSFVNSFRRNGQTALLTVFTDTFLDSIGQEKIFDQASTTLSNDIFSLDGTTIVNTSINMYRALTSATSIPFGEDPEESAIKTIKALKTVFMPNFPFLGKAANDIIEDL